MFNAQILSRCNLGLGLHDGGSCQIQDGRSDIVSTEPIRKCFVSVLGRPSRKLNSTFSVFFSHAIASMDPIRSQLCHLSLTRAWCFIRRPNLSPCLSSDFSTSVAFCLSPSPSVFTCLAPAGFIVTSSVIPVFDFRSWLQVCCGRNAWSIRPRGLLAWSDQALKDVSVFVFMLIHRSKRGAIEVPGEVLLPLTPIL
jgi:hypothetical protein